jgi:hypothetical protein
VENIAIQVVATYALHSSNNLCTKCPSGQKPNSTKDGCIQVESCSDFVGIKNGSQCSGYTSPKGNCFFNGDIQINNTEVKCSDVVDVIRCGDILEMNLCMYAKKNTYPNLIIDSLSSPSTMYCIWETTNETCVAKNSIKGGLECDKFSTDVCDLLQGCAVVGGVCVDHPCPDGFSLGDMKPCPFGCVINGSSSMPLSKSNRQLPHIPEHIANNISYLNPPNHPLHNFNNIFSHNQLLMNEFQLVCVLEVCARHSITDCFNHTEDTCSLSEDGCRFFVLFCFYCELLSELGIVHYTTRYQMA